MSKAVSRPLGFEIVSYAPPAPFPGLATPELKAEFSQVPFAAVALQKLIEEYSFDSVLDIGCGAGIHGEVFQRFGKTVTGLDYGKSIYYQKNSARWNVLIGDFVTMPFSEQFDCTWASHVLEHQRNIGLFLEKLFSVTREGGVTCVTVPPLGSHVLGGHLSLWNAGLLLYNMVLAGFDCREASIRRYGYNISVIVRKRTATLPDLAYDNGDVSRIEAYLPEGFHEGFDGDIWLHNW